MDIVFSGAVKKWVAPLEQSRWYACVSTDILLRWSVFSEAEPVCEDPLEQRSVVGLCIYRHFAPLEQGWVLYFLPWSL